MIAIPMRVESSKVEIRMASAAEYHPTTVEASFPEGGMAGDLLAKRTDADYDVEWITPADGPEEDNTRPITAAAVYTTVGNINALLETI